MKKALYGLKQASRAWYECLSKFLLEKDFSTGKLDTTLFIKRKHNDIMLVQIYVDDIIFGSTNDSLCTKSLDTTLFIIFVDDGRTKLLFGVTNQAN